MALQRGAAAWSPEQPATRCTAELLHYRFALRCIAHSPARFPLCGPHLPSGTGPGPSGHGNRGSTPSLGRGRRRGGSRSPTTCQSVGEQGWIGLAAALWRCQRQRSCAVQASRAMFAWHHHAQYVIYHAHAAVTDRVGQTKRAVAEPRAPGPLSHRVFGRPGPPPRPPPRVIRRGRIPLPRGLP